LDDISDGGKALIGLGASPGYQTQLVSEYRQSKNPGDSQWVIRSIGKRERPQISS